MPHRSGVRFHFPLSLLFLPCCACSCGVSCTTGPDSPHPGKGAIIFVRGLHLSRKPPCESNARNDRFDRRLTLWPSAARTCRGSKGCCSIPSGIPAKGGEANAAKTSFLQA